MKRQYLKWQTVSELTQNCMPSFFFEEAWQNHYLKGFAMEEIVVCLQKYIRQLSCLFTVSRGIEFLWIWKKLLEQRLKKRLYSANIIQYALLLRYTSIQSYKMLLEDFSLPSLSLFSKISKGKIDAIKCAQDLKRDGKISENMSLISWNVFTKMWRVLWTWAGWFQWEWRIYKRIICLIIGRVISDQVISTNTINAAWLRDELFEYLYVLYQCDLNVHVIVCDNH